MARRRKTTDKPPEVDKMILEALSYLRSELDIATKIQGNSAEVIRILGALKKYKETNAHTDPSIRDQFTFVEG